MERQTSTQRAAKKQQRHCWNDLHFDHFNFSSSRFSNRQGFSYFLRFDYNTPTCEAFFFPFDFFFEQIFFFSSALPLRMDRAQCMANMNVLTWTFRLIENDKHKSCMKNYVKKVASIWFVCDFEQPHIFLWNILVAKTWCWYFTWRSIFRAFLFTWCELMRLFFAIRQNKKSSRKSINAKTKRRLLVPHKSLATQKDTF